MCIMVGAAAASSLAAASAVAGIAGTVAGIMQSQQQMQNQANQFAYQTEMNNRQMDMQYQQAQRQAHLSRRAQIQKYTSETQAQWAANLSYNKQLHNNSEAANRVYIAEQNKVNEARTKAAFKSQEIYAKSIGAMGSVLASGNVGQSYGLMAVDAGFRQPGFATAEQNASIRSAETNAFTQMESAMLQNESANNQALAKIPAPVAHPLLEGDPGGFGKQLGLGIPTYNWGMA